MFGLHPDPQGYAVYLVDTMLGRRTLISRDIARPRTALQACGGDGRQSLLLSLDEREATDQTGWPDRLGGMPWCQFCRNPRPAWAYDGPRVEILMTASAFDEEPWPDVRGTALASLAVLMPDRTPPAPLLPGRVHSDPALHLNHHTVFAAGARARVPAQQGAWL